ncbi:RNA polymerase II C-terminal domain kinase beta subunit [Rhodotorula sphaerocarpa]
MALLGVPAPPEPAEARGPAPLAVVRSFRAYLSPLEVDHLVHLQAARDHTHALSDHRIHLYRQLAAGPRRTIATAQKLYHRFHLHFSLVDFPHQDVSLACLLVASKLEDTLKKLRDIQIAAWQVQNLLDGGTGVGDGDPQAQEAHRPHLIGIERLILQTICFNLNLHRPLSSPSSAPSGVAEPPPNNDDLVAQAALQVSVSSALTTGDAFRTVFRLASAIPSLPRPLQTPSPTTAFVLPTASDPRRPPPSPPRATATEAVAASGEEPPLKALTRLAFLLLTDVHRTLVPLSYPPHTCAAASVWLAGYLMCAAAAMEGQHQGREAAEDVWEDEVAERWMPMCESEPHDLGDIAQSLLDLLISLCPPPPLAPIPSAPGSSASLSNPSTTSPHLLVSPHSSLASPSESSSATLTTPATAASKSGSNAAAAAAAPLSDREKHLLAAGSPNAFSHPALRARYLGVDDLTQVKIRVRKGQERAEALQRARVGAANGSKRGREDGAAVSTANGGGDGAADSDPDAATLKRARRWTALEAGLAEVARIRDEKDLKERIRAEERAERNALKASAAAAAAAGMEGNVAAVEMGGVGAENEQERERERRERRERLKPGSVRYRF